MAKATKPLPSQQYLRECFDYDPETGVMTWRERPLSHFKDMERTAVHSWRSWNGGNAGHEAGCNTGHGRIYVGINGDLFARYRLAWMWMHGEDPGPQIDHINRDKSDDRISNLRPANNAENNRNRPAQGNNTSGFKGVSKKRDRWRARITGDSGRETSLGSFLTKEEAHAAYCEAAARLHGEFARTE